MQKQFYFDLTGHKILDLNYAFVCNRWPQWIAFRSYFFQTYWISIHVINKEIKAWETRGSRLVLSPILRSSLQTWSTTSRRGSKTKGAFLPTNGISFSLASSSRTATLCQITTSKRGLPSTWFSVFMVVCRSWSRCWPAKPSLLRLSHQIPSTLPRWRSRTRKASLLTTTTGCKMKNNA